MCLALQPPESIQTGGKASAPREPVGVGAPTQRSSSPTQPRPPRPTPATSPPTLLPAPGAPSKTEATARSIADAGARCRRRAASHSARSRSVGATTCRSRGASWRRDGHDAQGESTRARTRTRRRRGRDCGVFAQARELERRRACQDGGWDRVRGQGGGRCRRGEIDGAVWAKEGGCLRLGRRRGWGR